MTRLERLKIEAELKRVQNAKFNMETVIMDTRVRMAEDEEKILRIQEQIEIQVAKEVELGEKLKQE